MEPVFLCIPCRTLVYCWCQLHIQHQTWLVCLRYQPQWMLLVHLWYPSTQTSGSQFVPSPPPLSKSQNLACFPLAPPAVQAMGLPSVPSTWSSCSPLVPTLPLPPTFAGLPLARTMVHTVGLPWHPALIHTLCQLLHHHHPGTPLFSIHTTASCATF